MHKERFFRVAVYDRRFPNAPLDNVRLKITPPPDVPLYCPPDTALMYAARVKAYEPEGEAQANETCTGYAIYETNKRGESLMGTPARFYGEKYGDEVEVIQITTKGEISLL